MSDMTPGQLSEVPPPAEDLPEATGKPAARRRTRRAPGSAPARPRKPAAEVVAAPAPVRPESEPTLSVVAPPPPPPLAEGHRGRRSVSRTPVLVHPADIPEDAEGRIEFIESSGSEVAAEPLEDSHRRPISVPVPPASSWLAVAVVAAILVLVFVIGVALTR